MISPFVGETAGRPEGRATGRCEPPRTQALLPSHSGAGGLSKGDRLNLTAAHFPCANRVLWDCKLRRRPKIGNIFPPLLGKRIQRLICPVGPDVFLDHQIRRDKIIAHFREN